MKDEFNQDVILFQDDTEKASWIKEWDIPNKEQYVYAKLWLKGQTPVYADLIGYKDRFGVVLQTTDKRIVTVHPAYLKEMQSCKVIEPMELLATLQIDEYGQLSLF